MNGYLVAEHIAFKNDEEFINKRFLLEITEANREGIIEIAFDIGKTRHYIKFAKKEFEAEVKLHKEKYNTTERGEG